MISAEAAPAPEARRVGSVDALRGFDILWIIGGDTLASAVGEMCSGRQSLLSAIGGFFGSQLEHADWEGFRFYDFIFPLIVFITGVSIVFSLSRLRESKGQAATYWRVLRRFLLLYALGVLYYGGASHAWPDIRLTGVLNRIALCYLSASLLFLNFRLGWLIVAFVSILVGYWALMTFVPVPGIGAGSFVKGANLANWIDSQYLPGKKLEGTWDPEGLLSTLPAVGTCLLGVFAGLLLKDSRVEPKHKVLWLLGAGIAMTAVGLLWGLQFPIVKKIWTSSFVLVAGGFSALLLGAFYYLIDVLGWRTWAVAFVWLGANAITLYLVDRIVDFERLASRFVGGDVSSFFDRLVTRGTGHFVIASTGLALAVGFAAFLHRRKVFLHV